MALDTYTGLVASVQDWLDDTSFAAIIPDFILLTEADLNRRLRTAGQEVRSTATVSGEYLALPSDFGGMRAIHFEGTPDRPLTQMAIAEMLREYAGYITGIPTAYAISGGQLQFAPAPGSTPLTVELVYYRTIPPLTAGNPTNWLLTSHPDAYLIGCLLNAEMRGWDDKRLPLLKGRYDEVVAQISDDARRRQWGAAPVAPRPIPFQVRKARI